VIRIIQRSEINFRKVLKTFLFEMPEKYQHSLQGCAPYPLENMAFVSNKSSRSDNPRQWNLMAIGLGENSSQKESFCNSGGIPELTESVADNRAGNSNLGVGQQTPPTNTSLGFESAGAMHMGNGHAHSHPPLRSISGLTPDRADENKNTTGLDFTVTSIRQGFVR